jgi:zinc resistance-associated protein
MWKTVLAGTTALAIAGASLAYAQGPSGRDAGPHHWRPNAADITAFADARIAALHAGLTLTPDQEKNWPAVETALRDLSKQRTERFAARANAERPKDPVERLGQRAKVLSERGAALKKLADAADPLYKSLDDAQKQRFIVLARLGARQAWRHHRHEHGGPGAWHHRGQGSDGGRGRGMDGGPQPQ